MVCLSTDILPARERSNDTERHRRRLSRPLLLSHLFLLVIMSFSTVLFISRFRWTVSAGVQAFTSRHPPGRYSTRRMVSSSRGSSVTRCFSASSPESPSENPKNNPSPQKKHKPKNKWHRKGKFRVNEEVSQQQAAIDLTAAFDELARKEGFGSGSKNNNNNSKKKNNNNNNKSETFYADASTFEDDFDLEELEEFYDDDEDDDGDYFSLETTGQNEKQYSFTNENDLDDDGGPVTQSPQSKQSMEALLAAAKPIREINARRREDDVEIDDLLDEYLDMGGDYEGDGDDDSDTVNDDMEVRLAAAQKDLDRGQVSVDPGLTDLTKEDMRRLGFRQELDPFQGTETPRRQQYKLIVDAMACSACGADFQTESETKPGYLPPEKYEKQVKLSQIEELQRLKEKAETADWAAEDEVEYLLHTSGNDDEGGDPTVMGDIDIDAKAEELGISLAEELSKKKVICKRCHGLQNFGKVEEALRPGWTEEPLMSQQKFRDLLRPLSTKPCVLIAIVDLFDFSGSVLPELDAIAGDNPVILAANKADLLPSTMGQQRAENWVRRELEYMGIQSLANVGGAIRLISCKTGMGVDAMLNKAKKLADEMDADVYIVGAANAGKSTLMNYILRGQDPQDKDKLKRKKRAGNENAFKGALTTSPLPGTTLKFIKIELGDGRSLYDTPGLLVPGTLTQLLTPEELKVVVPTRQVEPITFRVASGKCVQVGGLARISVIGDSKPFLFTFFVANQIKLHPTDINRADELVEKHAGDMLTPPLAPGRERMEQIGEFEAHVVEIQGAGWKEAAADITLTGLGWVAVTGAGIAEIEIRVPKGIGVQVRPPLMPYDMWEVTAKYTGSRAVRKSSKSISGKRRKGVGRN